jgi:hypothetical protein
MGNMAFTLPFASIAEYGKCADAITADPAFLDWQVKNADSGLAEWIRSNLYREIPLS